MAPGGATRARATRSPLHVAAAQAGVWPALLRVDELARVADEEGGRVVADQVVVALLRVELEGKASQVPVGEEGGLSSPWWKFVKDSSPEARVRT